MERDICIDLMNYQYLSKYTKTKVFIMTSLFGIKTRKLLCRFKLPFSLHVLIAFFFQSPVLSISDYSKD